jgi:hypothetical protein
VHHLHERSWSAGICTMFVQVPEMVEHITG